MKLFVVYVLLVPPSLGIGTKVKLGPRQKENISSILFDIAMGKSEGERGGSTDDDSRGIVLGSVARALELVGGSRPRDNAAKMSAHYISKRRNRGFGCEKKGQRTGSVSSLVLLLLGKIDLPAFKP